MKHIVYLFLSGLILFLGSCGSKKDKIIVPSTYSDYYLRSVSVLEEELNENPDNPKLIKLQLSYYKNLNWPITALSAIERASEYVTVDPLIREHIISFYSKNGLYRELIQFFEELESLKPLSVKETEIKMKALLELGQFEEAQLEVNKILKNPSPQNLLMAGKVYSFSEEHILATYYYNKAFQAGLRDSVLCFEFVPNLYKYGFADQAKIVLAECSEYGSNEELKFLQGQILLATGDDNKGIKILSELETKKSFFFLSDWYRDKNVFDSSVYYVNQIVLRDSSDLEALMKLGNIFEARGFLSRSMTYYNEIFNRDSTYENVKEQIALVQRKIAYLRRLREKEQDLPILELESKKDINQ